MSVEAGRPWGGVGCDDPEKEKCFAPIAEPTVLICAHTMAILCSDGALETLNTLNRPVILVVDDLPVNIQLIQNYLSAVGYDTMAAHNGEEALDRIREHLPDLVLLDVMMPKMDGFETCRHLKHNLATQYIPVIMVTALNELDDKIRGIEAGADDFISKPFNRLELLARVKSLLRVKTLHDQLQVKVTAARADEGTVPRPGGHRWIDRRL